MFFMCSAICMQQRILETDILNVGWGISGGSLQYTSKYLKRTDGKGAVRSVVVERLPEIGMLNSHYTQNSQTLHEGDIESNYMFEKATRVEMAASYMRTYVTAKEREGEKLFAAMWKMLLGVGQREVDIVTKRYEEFTLLKKLFPHNRLLSREEIAQLEPALVDGRDPNIPLAAFYNPDGLAVDFGRVAKSMIDESLTQRPEACHVLTGRKVVDIQRQDTSGQLFSTLLDDGTIILSKAVVINAGGYTPVLLKKLWYEWSRGILSIAGNYYRITPSALHKVRTKVYMVQDPALPFAALHLDPEVDDPNVVRLWPTAFGIPYLEKKNRHSLFDYMGIINAKHDVQTFFAILKNPTIKAYLRKNFKFLIPIYGKWLFLKDARKIYPSLKREDIELLDGYGGNRPQAINRETHTLDFGETRVVGKHENIIGNTTPSPGASTAIDNAKRDIVEIATMPYFKEHFTRDQAGFDAEFAPHKTPFVTGAVSERSYQAPTQAPLS